MDDFSSWEIIGRGAERICYLNPNDATRLVKISPIENSKQTKRELAYFRYLIKKGVPFDYIPKFFGEIRQQGIIGIEQEFIRDDTGERSKSLSEYLSRRLTEEEYSSLEDALLELKQYLICYNVMPCDMTLNNIVVKKYNGRIKLIMIDGLGGTELIPISNHFKLFGQKKIERKWSKLIGKIQSKKLTVLSE